MKKIVLTVFLVCVQFVIAACNAEISEMEFFETESISPKENSILTQSVWNGGFYENPVIGVDDENIIPGWCIGDPFVIRWNGMYYLYPSSIGTGIQCWISEDLANWEYVGICMPDDTQGGCWAPEVTYYNGKFYMYTSPGGNGHYIYESDSPTGPFVEVSGNFGLNWDGNVFIDDDGSWTIYTADNGGNSWGLDVCDLTSPTEIDLSTKRNTLISMDSGGANWTEGSMLIKYNGIYYMTYCGNRVASKSYRINYSVSTESINDFVEGVNNPILLNTDTSTDTGLGHSSSVIGPNLDSYYIVYHSMITDPIRQMHVVPLLMNGTYLQALGHVETAPIPEMPDLYSRFDTVESLIGWSAENSEISEGKLIVSEGGKVLSEKGFVDDYTVEWNFRYIDGKAGALFGYLNDDNYGSAFIDTSKNELEIVFRVNGENSVYSVPMNGSFGEYLDFGVLQTLTLRKCGSEYTFLMNNITVLECESDLCGGAIGLATEVGTLEAGFVGAEGNVWLSSIKEYLKPISGEIQAITCVENDILLTDYNTVKYVSVSGGEIYNYYVNVTSSLEQRLGLHYKSNEDVSFEMYQNGKLLLTGELPSSNGADATGIFSHIKFDQGPGVLTFKIINGSADIFSFEFERVASVPEDYVIDISQPYHSEGEWSVVDGHIFTDDNGKFLYGDESWSDYTVSAEFTQRAKFLFAFLMFRVKNEAIGGSYDTEFDEGLNWYQGYNVSFTKTAKQTTISLNKQNYGPIVLASEIVDIGDLSTIDIKVEVNGANIKVYLLGDLIFDYTDPEPFLTGSVGFQRAVTASVSNLEIEPIKD